MGDFSNMFPDPEDSDSRMRSSQQVFPVFHVLQKDFFHSFKICFGYLTQSSSRRRVSMSLISRESQVFIHFLTQLPYLPSTLLDKKQKKRFFICAGDKATPEETREAKHEEVRPLRVPELRVQLLGRDQRGQLLVG